VASTRIPSPEERPLLEVEETARLLDWSRYKIYRSIQRGELPVMRRGRRVYVVTAALRRLLELDDATGS
jgi:excisionase family DNA binding protein